MDFKLIFWYGDWWFSQIILVSWLAEEFDNCGQFMIDFLLDRNSTIA